MPLIRANRDAIDDRFSVLGFTIRTESPLFEVGIATDPALFRPEHRAQRTRTNFYSSRASGGAIRARRGEAVYLVPADVLANFVGQPRLYFGLATYAEGGGGGVPDAVQQPGPGSMYVNLAGLTGRGLRRLVSSAAPSSYGPVNGHDTALAWGGDAHARTAPSAPRGETPTANHGYDDGFGSFPAQPAATPSVPAAPDVPANTPAVAQSYDDGFGPLSSAQEIIAPFYDPANPSSALTCQNDAFSQAREAWFVGVPNTRIFPHSAICQLVMTAPDGRMYQGTGTYIGRNRILTCAHNLHGMTQVTIIPGMNGAGGKPFGQTSVTSASWRVAPGYTGNGHWARDLAVIENVAIAAPNGQWFEFLEATPSEHMPIVVCGYSAASDAVPELTRLIDPDKQHLHGGYARSQSSPETLEYNLLTLKGASGSPVYHLTERNGALKALICAVHVSGQPATQGLNQGCFVTPDKIDWIEGRTRTFSVPATAFSIPLDPGQGGQSIGPDALEAGDIIVSTARHPVSYGIRVGTLSAVSHAMLYVGAGKVVEAVGSGVREVALETALSDAILAVAYRDPRVDATKAGQIVTYARSRVGNAYNYAGVAFSGYRILNPGGADIIDGIARLAGLEVGQAGASYCSELVYEAFERAGIPLASSRPPDSRPGDIVNLFGSRLSYVGHLVARNEILGLPLGLSSEALSGQSFAVHWDTTPAYRQSSDQSCWAASAAMVVGWRDNRRISDQDIAAKVPILDAYRNGLWPSERRALADTWGLVAEAPASYTITQWREMLEHFGPLYVDMTWDAEGGGHARVLVGMESDGAPDGSDTYMFMHDPWPDTRGRIKLTFAEFLELYEGRTGNAGGHLQYQILHSAQLPAHAHPALASPFSSEQPAQLPPPPAPVFEQPLNSQALDGGATVAIASVVVGAVMERLINNEGDITWELDQLRGLKHPNDVAPSPMPAASNGTVIRLTDWPSFTNHLGDEISAGFEINWQYNGKSVGNVLISNVATNDAVGWGLSVKAKIMDDSIVYPRDNPTFAAIKVRFEYRFTRAIGSDLIAIQDVHLFGNGRHNVSGRWEQS
ncbi:papain-like cysteine protease family protein [Chitinibacteraceae bacterium HSL-7]